jgi:glycosyltransferase involved in cell wall biosynthesis
MMARTRVSVVMPVYGAGPFLTSALASVFRQGPLIGEVIVVDDGSPDDVWQKLGPYRDRVRYVPQTNRGPAAARNAGVLRAYQDYVAFLDADDVWPDRAIDRALDRAQRGSDVEGVHGLTELLLEDESVSSGWRADGRPWRSPQLGSVVVRRQLLERAPFDESLRQGEDFEWFVRVRGLGTKLAPLDAVTLFYRLHAQNSTRGSSVEERNTLVILKRELDRRRRGTGVSC